MIASKGGHVVNIASLAGHAGTNKLVGCFIRIIITIIVIIITIIINNSSEGENVWPGTVLTLNPGLQGADLGPWARYQHPLDTIFQISQTNLMTIRS